MKVLENDLLFEYDSELLIRYFFHHDLHLAESTHFEPYSAVDGCVYLPLSAYEFDETPVEYHNILNVVKNAKDREQSQSDHQSCERFAVDAGRCWSLLLFLLL